MSTITTSSSKVLDRTGQEITSGSLIAYSSMAGHSAVMKIGKVLNVEAKENTVDDIKYTEYFITVRSGPYHPGVLRFPERIIVLDEQKVGEKFTYLSTAASENNN